MSTKIIDNPVYQAPQDSNINLLGNTGEILYCNGLGNLEKVNRLANYPDIKSLMDNSYNLTGKNFLLQIRNFFKDVEDGPWYIDLVNGVLYIHNRNFTDEPLKTYTYYQEHGEVIRASFSLQTKFEGSGVVSNTNRYNPLTEALESIVVGSPIDDKKYSPTGEAQELQPYNIWTPVSTRVDNEDKRNMETLTSVRKANAKAKAEQDAASTARYRNFMGANYGGRDSNGKMIAPINTSKSTRDKDDIEAFYTRNPEERNLQEAAWKVYQIVVKRANRELYRENFDYYFNSARKQAGGMKNGKSYEQNFVDCFNSVLYKNYKVSLNSTNVNLHLTGGTPNGEGGLHTGFMTLGGIKSVDQGNAELNLSIGRGEHIIDETAEIYVPFLHQNVKFKNGRGQYVDQSGNTHSIFYVYTRKSSKQQRSVGAIQYLKTAASTDSLAPLVNELSALQASQAAMRADINALKNELNRRKEKELTCDLEVVGRPSLVSGRYINLYNVGSQWSGKWYIKKCDHKLTPSEGYITVLSMVRRKG